MKYSLSKFVDYVFDEYKENVLQGKSIEELSPRLADLVYCALNVDDVVKVTYKQMKRQAGRFGEPVWLALKQSEQLEEAYYATKGKSYYEILDAVSNKSEEFHKEGMTTFKELFLDIARAYTQSGNVTMETENIDDAKFELYQMLDLESVGISIEQFLGNATGVRERCKKG